MKESEKRKRRVLTTGECCDPVSKISHHIKKRMSGARFGTGGLSIVAALTVEVTQETGVVPHHTCAATGTLLVSL